MRRKEPFFVAIMGLSISPVFWQNVATAANALGVLLQIVFIPLLMTPDQQGLFYSFIALLAAQTFFELGLSHVVVKEIASHSASVANCVESESDQRGDRFMELAKAVVITRKVYRLIAFASATFLVPVGLIYFHSLSGASQSAWGMSWIAAALSSSLLMLVIGDQSVIEGRGLVLEAAKSRAVVALSKQLGILGALAAGFGIWAVAAGAAASLCTFYGLHSRGNNLINPTVRISMTELLAWIKRNWAFNWRISVSAISGFFIFQYMTLVIGIFQGFAAAGRIGLAIQMANAPLWFAAPMVSTRRYSWIAMIEHGNRRELDESWSGATRLACIATAIMSIGVFAALIIVQYFPDMAGKNIAQKLPSLTEMALLLLVTLINQYVFSIAQYLRCHGKEPFYAISAISALCLAVLMPIACSFGARSALSLYLILAIFSAIAGKVIFDRFRRGFVCHS